MSLKKFGLWWAKICQRDHKPVTPEISNDELVAAYEWGALSNGDAPHFPSHARILAKIRGCPDSVITTFHNLGVAE